MTEVAANTRQLADFKARVCSECTASPCVPLIKADYTVGTFTMKCSSYPRKKRKGATNA